MSALVIICATVVTGSAGLTAITLGALSYAKRLLAFEEAELRHEALTDPEVLRQREEERLRGEQEKKAKLDAEAERLRHHIENLPLIKFKDDKIRTAENCPACGVYAAIWLNGDWDKRRITMGPAVFGEAMSNKFGLLARMASTNCGPCTSVAIETSKGQRAWQMCLSCGYEWLTKRANLE